MHVAQQFLFAVLDQVKKIALVILPMLARMGFSIQARVAALGAIGLAVLLRTAASFFAPVV